MSILAFIDNTNTVTLVLNTDPTLVSSFTTSTHIVDVSDQNIQVGWTYDGTTFTAPVSTPDSVTTTP
jgi:hypothetical protein